MGWVKTNNGIERESEVLRREAPAFARVIALGSLAAAIPLTESYLHFAVRGGDIHDLSLYPHFIPNWLISDEHVEVGVEKTIEVALIMTTFWAIYFSMFAPRQIKKRADRKQAEEDEYLATRAN